MLIQRQYSLPNCKLVLEGLQENPTPAISDRPIMTVLTGVTCHFPNRDQPLIGGRELLEALVQEVSRYTQSSLSGIGPPERHAGSVPLHLEPKGTNHHCLTIQPYLLSGEKSGATFLQIELSTVQLFDILEAIDQFLADTQTLPDLTLTLTPFPRHAMPSREAVAQQVVPAAIGFSGAVLVGLVCFFLPVPEITPPVENRSGETEQTGTATDQPNALGTGVVDLTTAPEITNAQQLAQLEARLYNAINTAWKSGLDFEEDLVYRVGVNSAGAIVGYKPLSNEATDKVTQTPLGQLLQLPSGEASQEPEPLGQFRVTFAPSGKLQVTPWQASP